MVAWQTAAAAEEIQTVTVDSGFLKRQHSVTLLPQAKNNKCINLAILIMYNEYWAKRQDFTPEYLSSVVIKNRYDTKKSFRSSCHNILVNKLPPASRYHKIVFSFHMQLYLTIPRLCRVRWRIYTPHVGNCHQHLCQTWQEFTHNCASCLQLCSSVPLHYKRTDTNVFHAIQKK